METKGLGVFILMILGLVWLHAQGEKRVSDVRQPTGIRVNNAYNNPGSLVESGGLKANNNPGSFVETSDLPANSNTGSFVKTSDLKVNKSTYRCPDCLDSKKCIYCDGSGASHGCLTDEECIYCFGTGVCGSCAPARTVSHKCPRCKGNKVCWGCQDFIGKEREFEYCLTCYGLLGNENPCRFCNGTGMEERNVGAGRYWREY